MGALAALIPFIIQAIPAGIQLEQFVASLIQQRTAAAVANRPDLDPSVLPMLDQLIDALQAKVAQDAMLHP